MNRRGWLGKALAGAAASLAGLAGLNTASGTSVPKAAVPKAPAAPGGVLESGRIEIRYWTDFIVISPTEVATRPPKVLFSYNGVTDERGEKGWMTRYFYLAGDFDYMMAVDHLSRMIHEDYDFTAEERETLIQWRDQFMEQGRKLAKEKERV